VFTIYEDFLRESKRVLVNKEEEILKRSKVRRDVIGNFLEVRSKILNAKNMAREMEMKGGNNVIGRCVVTFILIIIIIIIIISYFNINKKY